MADTHDHGVPHSHGADAPPHSHGEPVAHAHPDLFKTYMVIAVALSLFTAASFLINSQVRAGNFTSQTGFMLILAVAICKALLVGAYFMHLKFEWGKLYFMIIPAFILGFMMMIVLLPDIVFVWIAK